MSADIVMWSVLGVIAVFAISTYVRVITSPAYSDPCISSIPRSIMITTANSPVKGSGIPNQFLGVLLHTIAMSGLSRVRTELAQLLVIPLLAHHPVQANR